MRLQEMGQGAYYWFGDSISYFGLERIEMASVTVGSFDKTIQVADSTEPAEFWVACNLESKHAFDVFVAHAIADEPAVRTLIWTAHLDERWLLDKLVESCFSQLFGTRYSFQRLPEGHLLSGMIIKTRENADPITLQGNDALSYFELPIRKIEFCRLDVQGRQGLASFSCRACDGDDRDNYELTVLLERGELFSPPLICWALSIHQIAEFREAHNPDVRELVHFLNNAWDS